jgi:hypothetical protein
MPQKIITAHSASELNSKIEKYESEGWEPVSGHLVVTTYSLYQYRGNQIGGIKHDLEYSQTLRKING